MTTLDPVRPLPPKAMDIEFMTKEEIRDRTVDAAMVDSLVRLLAVNVNNVDLDDQAFRTFVRNSLPLAFAKPQTRNA